MIQKDIARLFPEIVSGIEVEYKDLGGDSGLASRWRKKLFLPSEAETDQLDQDGFDALYGTVLHESMHVTDSFLSGWGKSIVDVWSKVWSGTLFDEKTVGPKHQEIYNREYYELIGTETGSPTVPVWSNGEAPKSPVGVDTETLYEGTREND